MNRPTSLHTRLTIDRLGQRGEGVAQGDHGLVFVPYALAGEEIVAEVDGERGSLGDVIVASPDRVPAFCPHFTVCGGCAVQTLAWPAYAEWKRGLVVGALEHARLKVEVGALVDAHGDGRRRATFHARFDRHATVRVESTVGFMRARAHSIVAIDACPVLSPDMAQALPAARALADLLADHGKPLDIIVTATIEGLDIDLHGAGKIDGDLRLRLARAAETLDLARLSNHGDIVIERRTPLLQMGDARLAPPPGAFVQATVVGQEALTFLALTAIGKAKRVADLFAGVGTFALRFASTREVYAVESDAAMLAALARASNRPGLRPVKTEVRDLFRRPLVPTELDAFDAVVFDPPRAGAEAQAKALAASKVPVVVAVSCSAQTFARDAKLLVEGGYNFDSVTPVDQFHHSPHVEIVGVFRRPTPSRKRTRLLG